MEIINAEGGIVLTPGTARPCDIVRGSNPRPEHEIDPDYIRELATSFKAVGLLEPIVVRKLADGRWELIAGECRLRGWIEAFGDQYPIPMNYTEIDDKTWRDAAALTENVIRRAMSAVSQAEGAARVLGECAGDRDEAARRLGWKRALLDQRLALMHAADEVRQALHKKQINLGHAELLATCRKDTQLQALDLLLKQKEQGKQFTVADLKAYLDKAANVLGTAIFDKSDCTSCHHNSTNQQALFAEAISGDKCTNKQCFDQKTEAELEVRRKALAEDYQVVRIVRPGENLTVVRLVADGPKGVGPEQATACRTCKSFGAVISAVPDKMGQVFKDMCMDTPCNVRKISDFHKPLQEAAETPNGSPASANSPADGGAKASQSNKPTGKAASAPASSQPSNRVREHREALWRQVYKKVVAELDVAKNRSVLLALCLTNPDVLDKDALGEEVKALFDLGSCSTPEKALKKILAVENGPLAKALSLIPANVETSLEIGSIVGVLKAFDVKLADHWKVDKTFLELLTKNEIDAVCTEIGVKKAMGESYAKARNGGKADYIDAVLDAPNFDFSGRIPKLMAW